MALQSNHLDFDCLFCWVLARTMKQSEMLSSVSGIICVDSTSYWRPLSLSDSHSVSWTTWLQDLTDLADWLFDRLVRWWLRNEELAWRLCCDGSLKRKSWYFWRLLSILFFCQLAWGLFVKLLDQYCWSLVHFVFCSVGYRFYLLVHWTMIFFWLIALAYCFEASCFYFVQMPTLMFFV